MNINKIVIPQDFNELYLLIPILPITGLKLWFFERNKKWKKYIAEFEAWPEKRKKKWNSFMRLIVFIVIGNLIFSFYQMSQIDWRQYR